MSKDQRDYIIEPKSTNYDEQGLYKKIADGTPIIIWHTKPSGKCTFINKKWYDYTGQKEDEALGFGWLNSIHLEDRDHAEEIFQQANKDHKSFQIEYRLKRKDGKYRWHLDSGQPQFNELGVFIGFVGAVADIHDRKLAEEKLRESEKYYKSYAEAMPQMAFIADAKGDIIYFNKRWYDYIAGMGGTEGWGWKDKPIHHPDDLKKTIDRWNHSLATGEPYEIEYRLRRFDGKYLWHLGRAMPVLDDAGQVTLWLGTNTDIHKQKQTEEALKQSEKKIRESEDRYRAALKNSPIVFAKCDTQLRYVWIFNPHMDYQPDSIIGKRDDEIDQSPGITALVNLKQHVIDTRQQIRDEVTFDLTNGARTFDITLTPLIENNHLAGVITASLDITERKQVENALQKAYDQLTISNQDLTSKNEQLAKVSQLHQNLLYIIAHDLRSPISNMYLMFDLLEDEQDPEEIIKLKNSLKQMVARQETILNSLGEIIKAQSVEDIKYQTVNLKKITADILKSNELGLKEVDGRIDCNFDEVKVINHVHSFVYSILRNLVTNAIKYHQEGRPLEIVITSSRKDDYVLVTVADNGMGMDLEKQGNNLFKPFKRLTTKASGTGIGLYIIKSLIEKNGGYIEVSSTPGQGTTFYCYFKEF